MTPTAAASPEVPAAVRAAAGFDPARSAGLFVGISRFDDPLFAPVAYAVDDAVDLAHLFAVELRLVAAAKIVLALAGEPAKAESRRRLESLVAAGAERRQARQVDVYAALDRQRRAARHEGLFVAALATHGFSDQGGDFLVAADSLRRRIVRTGVAVDELFDDVARARSPRRIVFLDACRERLSAATRAGGEEPAAVMSQGFADAIAAASGQAVLAGAVLGGFAYDDVERQNGVFTATVVDGLRGRAGADDRGLVTVRTLGDYVHRQVVTWVREHRPEHAALSQGIARRIEGAAADLPLAVDPLRRQAEEAYRWRREAALALLRANIGEILPGALYDDIAAAVLEKPRAEAEALLAEIEGLDGSVQSQRSLAYSFQQYRAEVLGAKPPAAEVGPADETAAAPGRRRSRAWGSGLAKMAVGLLAVVGVTAWIVGSLAPETEEQEEDPADVAVTAPPPGEPAPASSEPRSHEAGDLWTSPSGMRFRYVSAGSFEIGSPTDEAGRDENETTRASLAMANGLGPWTVGPLPDTALCLPLPPPSWGGRSTTDRRPEVEPPAA